jgi:hypothetical protein
VHGWHSIGSYVDESMPEKGLSFDASRLARVFYCSFFQPSNLYSLISHVGVQDRCLASVDRCETQSGSMWPPRFACTTVVLVAVASTRAVQ